MVKHSLASRDAAKTDAISGDGRAARRQVETMLTLLRLISLTLGVAAAIATIDALQKSAAVLDAVLN